MHSAFISYSHRDRRLAREIAAAVKQLGGRVWIDEGELRIGDSLIERIRDGIDSFDFMIAIISHHSVASSWVSRELDVAMNQEIQGKRVKVLPVRATACELPGFLKGKLYADMTTPAAKKRAMPSLLERLGATDEQLDRFLSDEPATGTDYGKRINELREALRSEDESVRYTALIRAAESNWSPRALLNNLDVLESVCTVLEDESPPHFKVHALKLVGMTADAGFSYRIEPLLRHDNPHVVAAAIGALGRLKARCESPLVLETLRRTASVLVRDQCLKFFSQVHAATSYIALSLLGVCDELLRTHEGDSGVESLVVSALGKQLPVDDDDHSVGRRVIELLAAASDAARLVLLKSIFRNHEDAMFFYAADLSVELREVLEDLSKSDSPRIVGASWAVRTMLAYFIEETRDRGALWKVIQTGDESTVTEWLDNLEDYYARFVFDDPTDVDGLVSLCCRFEGQVADRAYGLICQLDFDQVLERLVQLDYEPDGWATVWTLRKLALVEVWNPEYARLLDAGLRDPQPEHIATAWALLARLKGGRIGTGELLAAFPNEIDDRYVEPRLGRDAIVDALEALRMNLKSSDKRRLSRLISSLRK